MVKDYIKEIENDLLSAVVAITKKNVLVLILSNAAVSLFTLLLLLPNTLNIFNNGIVDNNFSEIGSLYGGYNFNIIIVSYSIAISIIILLVSSFYINLILNVLNSFILNKKEKWLISFKKTINTSVFKTFFIILTFTLFSILTLVLLFILIESTSISDSSLGSVFVFVLAFLFIFSWCFKFSLAIPLVLFQNKGIFEVLCSTHKCNKHII